MIDELCIKSFRGIKELTISGLSRINLIFGENNAGKTSLLESLRLLALGARGAGINSLLRLRAPLLMSSRSADPIALAESLFPYGETRNEIVIEGRAQDQRIWTTISSEGKEVVSQDMIRRSGTQLFSYASPLPIETLPLAIRTPKAQRVVYVGIPQAWAEKIGVENMPSVLIASYDHLQARVLSPFLQDEELMGVGLRVCKSFDARIVGLRYDEDHRGGAVDYVDLEGGRSLPLSSFGDGLRRCLYILGGLKRASGGILLVDEFDDGLHPDSYFDFTDALSELAYEYNVQVFMTSHKNDIFDTSRLNEARIAYLDKAISVITLKKIGDSLSARVLSFKDVLTRIDDYGFEARR